MARNVRVNVVSQEEFDTGPFKFSGTLDRVIKSLVAIRETIPEEYRATAHCDINSSSGYEGDHYANIDVSYSRPETAEETTSREAGEHRATEARQRHEKTLLANLKAKYEVNVTP